MLKKSIFSIFVILMLSYLSISYAATTKPVTDNTYYIFTGNANKPLAEAIAYQLRSPMGNAKVARYRDGEISIKINENIKNKNVFIVQSTCKGNNVSMNDSIMELYLLTRTLKRNGAKSITVFF